METLVDDIGSFPLPTGIKREEYAKAYEKAREFIIKGQDPFKDPFTQMTFCKVVIESFRKKAETGLDATNFPQHFSGIRQVGDAVHDAMGKGSFVVDQDKAILPEIYVLDHEAKRLSEELGKRIALRVSIFGPIEQYLAEVGATAYPDVLDGFAQTINRFAKNSILNTKYIETKVISIDEPSLGHSSFSGSPELIREALEKAYDFQGPIKQIHLHFASGVHDLPSRSKVLMFYRLSMRLHRKTSTLSQKVCWKKPTNKSALESPEQTSTPYTPNSTRKASPNHQPNRPLNPQKP